MSLLLANRIRKTYRHSNSTLEILSGISLEAQPGESIAITGRSGEGKTTLLHILGTLESYDDGELVIAGNRVDSGNAAILRNRHIGFVFQSFNLLEDFTTLENVLMPSWIGRHRANHERGMELLASVGLSARAHFPVKLLSGGERQRVAIARALCNDPDLLFADEPTGNLDRTNAAAIGDLLFDLTSSRKKTLLLVTHDLALAARCTRRFTLAGGTLMD